MALISGKVEEQLEREEDEKAAAKEWQEAPDAELQRKIEQGELELADVLEDPATSAESDTEVTGAQTPVRPPEG